MGGQGLGDSPAETVGDRYEIVRQLGKKAGRETLLARDKHAEELVVVKLLTFSKDFNWDDLKLFERETETLKALSHPAIPRYLDSFEVDAPNGKGFALVQTYIPAKSLEEHLKEGRTFSEAEVKQIAKGLLEILIYLHGQKPPAIHRDIKPSNILLTNRSGNSVGEVYLVDFGSVQTLATKEGRTVTVVGTYGYMPPEQFGGRAVSASDLYSLGATLIALVTKQHPADLPQTDMRIEFEQAAQLSPAFVNWLKWMTEPSLDRRCDSAESAKEALENPKFRDSYPLCVSQEKSVTTLDLLWNSIWRSTGMGVTAITGYAALYSTFIFPFYGTIAGGIFGGILGLGLGFANGLLVGILTRLFFFPLANAKFHRQLVSTISTVVCTSVAIVYFNAGNFGNTLNLVDCGGDEPAPPPALSLSEYIFWVVAPAAIAGLSMGVVSKSFARWYEQESRR